MPSETGSAKTAIREFHVNVPEADLTELRRRVNATKWPERARAGLPSVRARS
jgi:hypothetical protein